MSNLKELKAKYAELGKEIEKLESNKGKWLPEENEEYWFVQIDRSIKFNKNNMSYDREIMKYNKVFQTQSEAKAYADYINARDEYTYEFSQEEWEDGSISKYCIYFNYGTRKLEYSNNYVIRCLGELHFKTEQKAQEFIDKYEKEILKYEIGIEV